VDYFTFFGLPRKLNLDIAALDKDFYELSRKLHPDLNARAGEPGAGVEPATEFPAQRRSSHLERSNQAHAVSFETRRRGTGRAVEDGDRAGALHGQVKKQIVPPDLLEEVFELNMQLEELRMQKKPGEDDPALIEEIGRQKLELEEKQEALLRELEVRWKMWDGMIQREQNGQPVSDEERKQERDKMVDVLNRRNYIRNLVGM
jgi:molecular chaperone HscB